MDTLDRLTQWLSVYVYGESLAPRLGGLGCIFEKRSPLIGLVVAVLVVFVVVAAAAAAVVSGCCRGTQAAKDIVQLIPHRHPHHALAVVPLAWAATDRRDGTAAVASSALVERTGASTEDLPGATQVR